LINELIMGRDVKVKVPLAETTLDNMVAVMPGAVLTTDGVKASGTVTITTNPTDAQTITLNGKTIVFKTIPIVGQLHSKLGATAADTAKNLAEFLNTSEDPALVIANAKAVGSVVTLTADAPGTAGNAYTTVTGTAAAAVTMGSATLAGGTDATKAYVTVPTGIGIDLLSIAKELRLHPKASADDDFSDDFTIPLAATAGALTFAYQLEAERIFNCEFSGYPDSVTSALFIVGDNS
jgi:hypothetical protein